MTGFGIEPSRGPAWSGRLLRLEAEPIAANAPVFAERAVEGVRRVAEANLDYTPGSLLFIDTVLKDFARDGSDMLAEYTFWMGCYVGEVFVRSAGYRWVDIPEDEIYIFGSGFVIERPDGDGYLNPVGKVFKRVDNGEGDSVADFYAFHTRRSLAAVRRETPAPRARDGPGSRASPPAATSTTSWPPAAPRSG